MTSRIFISSSICVISFLLFFLYISCGSEDLIEVPLNSRSQSDSGKEHYVLPPSRAIPEMNKENPDEFRSYPAGMGNTYILKRRWKQGDSAGIEIRLLFN